MAVTIALAGDTMLGRGVGEEIIQRGPYGLFAPEVVEAFRQADLRILNLECCVSTRGSPVPGRVFHFRAPPAAVAALEQLGVDCVTMANNHSLDYGEQALGDTLDHLRSAGITPIGAGRNESEARAPAVLRAGDMSVAVLAVTDHPSEYAAGKQTPGVAYAPLSWEVPRWLTRQVGQLNKVHDAVIVTPHWGPNMTTEPLGYVRAAAEELIAAGATLVAGHSAHVFHGVANRVVYDLGDFIDDYATDEHKRNNLSLLYTITIDTDRNLTIRALPLALDYAHTRRANERERTWIRTRLTQACTEFNTKVTEGNSTLTLEPKA
jgi:poly-gamma-glutamate capsule biosynthesis protein CapA/YwtB (metallophosphatase superfamily)